MTMRLPWRQCNYCSWCRRWHISISFIEVFDLVPYHPLPQLQICYITVTRNSGWLRITLKVIFCAKFSHAKFSKTTKSTNRQMIYKHIHDKHFCLTKAAENTVSLIWRFESRNKTNPPLWRFWFMPGSFQFGQIQATEPTVLVLGSTTVASLNKPSIYLLLKRKNKTADD